MNLDDVKKKMDFIGGAYLDSSAFPENGIDVNISALKTEMVENMKTFKKEEKKILYFEEFQLGMVLNAKCSRKKLLELAGGDKGKLKGLRVNIYRDPTVKFGKNVTGGLRFKAASTQKKELSLSERQAKTIELLKKAGVEVTTDIHETVTSCETPEQLKEVFETLTAKEKK